MINKFRHINFDIEMEEYFVKFKIVVEGNCEAVSLSFMKNRMLVPVSKE